MLPYHRRFDEQRDLYRASTRGLLEHGEHRALTGEEYVALQERRAELTDRWLDWFAEHRVDALLEPTVPIVARPRGAGYDAPFTRRGGDLAHPLLGLDGLPGRRAPGRRRARAAASR